MLTIDRPSPLISNKIVVATMVFAVGFVGSLSLLRIFEPGLGQLSSGRENTSITRSGPSEPDKDQTGTESTDQGGKQTAKNDSGAAGTAVSHDVQPVAPASVSPPASAYSGPASATEQPSGSAIIPAIGEPTEPTDVSPKPSPVVPSSPAPTTSLNTQTLTGTVSETAETILPSF